MNTWQRRFDRYAVLVHALAALAIGWSILAGMNRLPAQWRDPDSLQMLSFIHPLWEAFWTYGEYPVWNPYFGGGVPWAGYVYNPGLSVTSLIYLLCGPFVGIKIYCLLVLFGGGLGLYAFARLWFALDPRFALVSSLTYMTVLWLPYRMISGNFDEVIIFLAPVAGVLMWGLLHGRWWGLLLPLLFQALFAQAKYGPFIVAFLPAACVVQWAGLSWSRLGRGLLMFALAFGAGVALSLPKLLSLMVMLERDLVDQSDIAVRKQYTPAHFFDYLIGHFNVMAGRTNAHMGVGVAAVALAVVGLAAARGRGAMPAALFGVSALFAMGENSPVPLYRILQALPVFDTMRDYSKYWNLLPVVCVCLLAGLGLEVLAGLLARVRGSRVCSQACTSLAAVCLVAMVLPNALLCGLLLYPRVFTAEPGSEVREPFHHVAHRELHGRVDRYRRPDLRIRELNHDQYHLLLRGIGTLTWYGNLVFAENAIPRYFIDDGRLVPNPDYTAEVWWETDKGARQPALGHAYTYNTMRALAEPMGGRTLVFNTNYSSYWQPSVGRLVNSGGRVGVVLPPSYEGEVRLRFVDPTFRLGLLGALLAALLWFGGMPLLLRSWRAEATAAAPHASDDLVPHPPAPAVT